MEETIKRLQIALGILLVALIAVFILGATLILSDKPKKEVAVQPSTEGANPPAAPAVAALSAEAQKGETLFKNNCSACHNVNEETLVGPGLKGVEKRTPGKEWLYKWIHNSSAVVASGDKYGTDIFNKFNKLPMQSFPDLTNEEIDNILKYVAEKGGS